MDLLVAHRRGMWKEIGGATPKELAAADPVYRHWALEGLREGWLLAFVAEDDRGRALGSGALWLAPSQPRPGRLARSRLPYILSMYTLPSARGRGVASALVGEMVRWAEAHGYPRVTLHASVQGRPVYERLGFVASNEMRRELPARARGRGSDRPGRSRAPAG